MNASHTYIKEIIEKYEIPKEFIPAIYEAFEKGGERMNEIMRDKEIAKLIEEYNGIQEKT